MKFKLLGVLPEYINKSWHGSQAPSPQVLDGCIRVWFSARDHNGYSQATYYDISKDYPSNLFVQQNYRVQIPLGSPGEADSNGAMPSMIEGDFIHYTGWNKTDRADVRYRTACMTYHIPTKRKSIICDRTTEGPCGSSMPFYQRDMLYYMAYQKWENSEPFYNIAYEPLGDNRHVFGAGVEVDLDDNTGGIARPVIKTINDIDCLFYSKRGKFDYRTDPEETYKMYVKKAFYYDSSIEEPVIVEGDDNHFQAYAYPIKVDDRVLLFYNSGSFTSAIHVAELVEF